MQTMTRIAAAMALAVLFAAAACSDDDEAIPSPTITPTLIATVSPAPASATPVPNEMKSPDDLFADIADQAPGFGGLFYTPGDMSALNVYLTDPDVDLALVKQAILSVLNLAHYQIDPNVTIRPLQGRYDWRDLKRWYDLRYNLPESSRLTQTDINEGTNRLEFGVANEDDIEPVTQSFLDAGVPADAFEVHVAAPVIPL